MNKFLKISAPMVAVALAGLTVNATPITGNSSISFDGNVTLDHSIPTATQATAISAVTLGAGATGSYAGVTPVGAITFNPFVFSASSGFPSPLWSFKDAANTLYTFTLSSDSIVFRDGSTLDVSGMGTLAIGGDTATGSFTFDFSDAGSGSVQLTFQNSNFTPAPPVPDGGTTLSLLGGALMGLGLLKRKFMA